MRILYSTILVFFLFPPVIFAQYSITFQLPDINVHSMKPGDEIVIPVSIADIYPKGPLKGGRCIGFQLFFEFDHELLAWKGTSDNPLPGVQNFSSFCPYSSADWLFNDNGIDQVALWIDPIYSGEYFPVGTVLFEYIFIYKGGLPEGQTSPLVWSKEEEVVDGRMIRGKTEAYTDQLKLYDSIILRDGAIYNE